MWFCLFVYFFGLHAGGMRLDRSSFWCVSLFDRSDCVGSVAFGVLLGFFSFCWQMCWWPLTRKEVRSAPVDSLLVVLVDCCLVVGHVMLTSLYDARSLSTSAYSFRPPAARARHWHKFSDRKTRKLFFRERGHRARGCCRSLTAAKRCVYVIAA